MPLSALQPAPACAPAAAAMPACLAAAAAAAVLGCLAAAAVLGLYGGAKDTDLEEFCLLTSASPMLPILTGPEELQGTLTLIIEG